MKYSARNIDPARILDAIPERNTAVTAEEAGEQLVLAVPLRRRWWMHPLIRAFLPVQMTRKFGLDPYGREVWEACNGQSTVEHICESFARTHQVSFEEARAAVYKFLTDLTQRELLVVHVPHSEGCAS